MIILPRQARDKHRENSKRATVLLHIGEAIVTVTIPMEIYEV
eukprot:COSAG06_NODE_15389_length_1074_cov_1.346667_1_plen_42_part_01